MSLIKGSWGATVFVCGNHPDLQTPPEMTISQGPHSLFYSCPKYDAQNRTIHEKPCFNRINLIEYENALEHIAEEFVKAEEQNETPCLLHHKWKRKTIEFEIIEHSDNKIVVKFVDLLAIKGRKV